MRKKGTVDLEFHPDHNNLGKEKELRDGLSAVVQIGDSLWVANDETISLERLTLGREEDSGTIRYARQHQQFLLNDYLRLPVPPLDSTAWVEADVEGLAFENGFLWLVGSHSLKRKKPKFKAGVESARRDLAKISSDGNRYLLARIPVVENDGEYTLVRDDEQNGTRRTASQLPGDENGDDLTTALLQDEHLAPFLSLPGKDNGFDIEGLAVVGQRLFIGLRGPVLRGWAVILEVEVQEDAQDPSILRLQTLEPDGRLYLKHFLHLGGTGIRDLCVHGEDLLILAGPTMDVDGPVTVFRWRGGTRHKGEAMVTATATANVLERVLEVPYAQGEDRAEGITVFSPPGGEEDSLLVVYDSASESRQLGESTMTADIFALPGPQ